METIRYDCDVVVGEQPEGSCWGRGALEAAMASPSFVFRSLTGDVAIPEGISLPDYILEGAERHGSRKAIVDGTDGHGYSYAEVKRLVYNTVTGLTELGIRPGDAVMLLLPNCPEYPLLFLAIVAAGAIVTTANPTYGVREISKQLKDSKAKLIITIEALADKVEESKLAIVLLGKPRSKEATVSQLFAADGSKAVFPKVSDHDVCVLPYSSGTTGDAKGVMLTHRNVISNVAQHLGGVKARLETGTGDVTLALLPMFHIYAMTCINMVALKAGATLVTMPRFDLEHMLTLGEKYGITMAPLVPPIILALAKSSVVNKYKWHSLKKVVSGAAPLGADLELAFRSRFPKVVIGQGYGMTESSPTLTLSRGFMPGGGLSKPGSAGAVLPNTELIIVDTATGQSLPANQRGELCVRGPQVMKGYLNQPEATAVTIDKDGWLHTGDVAFVDEEGEVFIVDRVKELIKYKGFQVPPAELESILLSHSCISDAAVVPKSHEEAGEVPVAFVVRSEKRLTEGEVKEFVAKQVAPYKRLHGVIFVEAIPKSASGKILRRELKSRL